MHQCRSRQSTPPIWGQGRTQTQLQTYDEVYIDKSGAMVLHMVECGLCTIEAYHALRSSSLGSTVHPKGIAELGLEHQQCLWFTSTLDGNIMHEVHEIGKGWNPLHQLGTRATLQVSPKVCFVGMHFCEQTLPPTYNDIPVLHPALRYLRIANVRHHNRHQNTMKCHLRLRGEGHSNVFLQLHHIFPSQRALGPVFTHTHKHIE